jgi:polyisoprenoid-binding protein YceI
MSTAVSTPVRTYQIDKAHSEATFQVRHLLSRVRGRFSDFAGTILFDEATPARSAVEFTVQTSSIDTAEPDRDKHLRSGDFFDVENFPTLTFMSESVTPHGGGHFDVAGTLTIRGTSKAITIPITYLGTARDPWGRERAAFEAEVTLNRKDFGLNWNAALETSGFLVGDDVRVSLSIQAVTH